MNELFGDDCQNLLPPPSRAATADALPDGDDVGEEGESCKRKRKRKSKTKRKHADEAEEAEEADEASSAESTEPRAKRAKRGQPSKAFLKAESAIREKYGAGSFIKMGPTEGHALVTGVRYTPGGTNALTFKHLCYVRLPAADGHAIVPAIHFDTLFARVPDWALHELVDSLSKVALAALRETNNKKVMHFEDVSYTCEHLPPSVWAALPPAPPPAAPKPRREKKAPGLQSSVGGMAYDVHLRAPLPSSRPAMYTLAAVAAAAQACAEAPVLLPTPAAPAPAAPAHAPTWHHLAGAPRASRSVTPERAPSAFVPASAPLRRTLVSNQAPAPAAAPAPASAPAPAPASAPVAALAKRDERWYEHGFRIPLRSVLAVFNTVPAHTDVFNAVRYLMLIVAKKDGIEPYSALAPEGMMRWCLHTLVPAATTFAAPDACMALQELCASDPAQASALLESPLCAHVFDRAFDAIMTWWFGADCGNVPRQPMPPATLELLDVLARRTVLLPPRENSNLHAGMSVIDMLAPEMYLSKEELADVGLAQRAVLTLASALATMAVIASCHTPMSKIVEKTM